VPPRQPVRGHSAAALTLGVAAAFFFLCAAWLVSEGQRLGGRAGQAEQAVGAASLALGLLAGVACARWGLCRPRAAVHPRLGLGGYVGVLATCFALTLTAGHLWSAQGRPALGAFAALVACAGLPFGFSLLPWLVVDERGLLDALGRRIPAAALSRYALQPVLGAPGRHNLRLWTRDEQRPVGLVLVGVEPEAIAASLDALGIPRLSR